MPPSFDADDQSTALLQQFEPSLRPEARFVVTVTTGDDAGKSLVVDGSAPSSLIVGQSPACDLRLVDPTVSRRHVALDLLTRGLKVRDLGSTNGTFLGGVRIVEAHARGGEELVLGGCVLRVNATFQPSTAEPPVADRFGGVLGASRAMRRLFPLLDRLAKSAIPVLIEGETGTGKEAVAQAIHDCGPRAQKPFVLFDCTAIAPNLVESELFGHEKGAFTGATGSRLGVFEQANGGTLFIDELGDLPLDLQAKLLRAIDTGQVRRVGGDRWTRSDARVIAATRRDIEAMILDGRFRDDLFHRLAVGRVSLPPLRERAGDAALLIEYFCRVAGAASSTIRRSAMAEWLAHPWPGNVRELRNAVARELALGELASPPSGPSFADGAASRATAAAGAGHSLPTGGAGRELESLLAGMLPYDEARLKALEIFQRHYVERALRSADGNAARAAAAAGIAVRYFHLLRARSRTSAR